MNNQHPEEEGCENEYETCRCCGQWTEVWKLDGWGCCKQCQRNGYEEMRAEEGIYE